MSLFDLHSIYCPIEGKLMGYWSMGMQAGSPGGAGNKAAAFWIRTDEGDDITVAIARSFFGGPISFSYHTGERVGHGRRIGFAMLGSIVSVYAAENTRVEVVVGQRVAGADTVVATLTHDQAVTAISPEGSGSGSPAA
jgi:phosphatidylserine decarboxylase